MSDEERGARNTKGHTMQQPIYVKMKSMRNKNSITGWTAARAAGVTKRTLQRWESGKIRMPASYVDVLHELCGSTPPINGGTDSKNVGRTMRVVWQHFGDRMQCSVTVLRATKVHAGVTATGKKLWMQLYDVESKLGGVFRVNGTMVWPTLKTQRQDTDMSGYFQVCR